MEGITLFVSIVIIIFGLLQVVLFFKLWGMTNNVSRILIEQKESKKDIIEQMKKIGSSLLIDNQQSPNLQKNVSTSMIKGQWGKDVTIAEKYEAAPIAQALKAGQIIIKFENSNKLDVCEQDKLRRLSDREYKIIYSL